MRVYILRELTTKSLYNVSALLSTVLRLSCGLAHFYRVPTTAFMASPFFFSLGVSSENRSVAFVYIFRHGVKVYFQLHGTQSAFKNEISSPLVVTPGNYPVLRIHRDYSLLDNLPHPSSKDAHVHSETVKFLQDTFHG